MLKLKIVRGKFSLIYFNASVTIMLDVCYKSSAILHGDIAQTSDSFEGKRFEFDLETLLGKSLRPIF